MASLDDNLSERDEQLALLLAELTDASLRGETVDIERACRSHPDLAQELRELWGAANLADVAAADSGTTDGEFPPLGDVAATLKLPVRHGDYELLEEIGRGGMGVVYRARQISLNREVAVKMILDPSASTAALRRFRAEAEAAAGLDHPNIVPVYEVGEMGGRPFFSMKLIEGETLSSRIQNRPLPQREAARIVAVVARAIHAAHEQGVLHRDLKPSNILMDAQAEPHVMDFGLAKMSAPDAATLTRTGAVLGTPAYIAPEQASGNRGQVGPAGDVYSLGTILYHLTTGRPPFQAATPVETVMMVLEQDPVPPRRIVGTIDRDIEMITLRCLQKPPDLRYPTAAALADDLEAYLKDETISARSGRFGQVVGRIFRDTHHAPVLENWGVLWMWHSLVLLIVCLLTEAMVWCGYTQRWQFVALWTVALWAWGAIFWRLRRRLGPVLFVERQVAHVWAASMIAIACMFPLEMALGLDVLTLSPALALIASMVFLIKAGILSGGFYIQAAALLATAVAMTYWRSGAHVVFGVVAAACFFFPGLKYYRRGRRRERHRRPY